ncbi:MAG: PfkB family carbohydrate kinase [Thermoplasmata archaeon]
MAAPRGDSPEDAALLVSGHVNVDRFLTFARWPPLDRTAPVTSERTLLGGTAANLARVTAGAGLRTGLVARVGGDFPPPFLRALRDGGVDCRGVERVPGLPTPTCYILADRHHAQRTLIQQGPMGDSDARPPSSLPWSGYRWLHVTTGPVAWQLALAEAARRNGLRVAADPAQEIHYRWDARSLARLLGLSEILFGNRAEIARAARLAGGRSARDLLPMVPLVIETGGPRGVRVHTRSGGFRVAAERPRRIDTLIGSGDAFRGGFYTGWFAGDPLDACVRRGIRTATRWIEGRWLRPILLKPSSGIVAP